MARLYMLWICNQENDGMKVAHLGERRCVIRFGYFFVPWRLNCLQERRLVNTRRQLRVSRPYAWPPRRIQPFVLSPLQRVERHEPPHSLCYRLKRPREAAPKLTRAENMAFANQHNTMKQGPRKVPTHAQASLTLPVTWLETVERNASIGKISSARLPVYFVDVTGFFLSCVLPKSKEFACVVIGSQKMVVLVRNPLSSELQCVTLPAEVWSVGDFLRSWCQAQGLPQDHFYIKCNGRCINSESILQDGALYNVEPRLCGGKGGFGSMLRALGAQIEKTTNREACRDLSGRRLRDVNHEKAMAEWVKQQAEREADKEQRRLERLKRKLVEPKHFFTNPDYQQQCHEMAERLEDSVLKGMQASSSTVVSPESSESRKGTTDSGTGPPSEKKRCLWLGIEGLDDPNSSETNSDEEDESPGTSGRCSTSSGSHISVNENLNEFPRNSEESVNCSSGSDEKSEDQTKNAKKDQLEDPTFSKIEANEKHKTTQILKEEKHTNASCSEKASQLQHADTARVNLMEFNSVAELEAIGLDKLKFELLALGLKCGGTLQERAERLFSVRGLARDQIDPALFAKPSKGKKK